MDGEPGARAKDIQQQRMRTYVREGKQRPQPLPVGQPLTIPTTSGEIRFTKGNKDWETDRDKDGYNAILFSDEFDKPAIGQPPTRKQDRGGIIAGGQEAAFAPGKTVLDLGSGEALALLEYAEEFPDTTFIGIDMGYDQQQTVEAGRPGVQLTRDNWNRLDAVPDESVDTFLSSVAISRWELGDGESNELLGAVSRKAKQGAIFRFDHVSDPTENENVRALFDQHGWDVEFAPDTVVAVRREPEPVSAK